MLYCMYCLLKEFVKHDQHTMCYIRKLHMVIYKRFLGSELKQSQKKVRHWTSLKTVDQKCLTSVYSGKQYHGNC